MTIPLKFNAKTENATDIYTLLRPLGSKVANCIISEEGMQFIVEVDKILLIQTWIPSDIFRDWNFIDLEFSIDIGILVDSLNVFSQENVLEIEYISDEFVLSSAAEVFTTITLKTYDKIPVASLLSVFGDSEVLGKIIIKVL